MAALTSDQISAIKFHLGYNSALAQRDLAFFNERAGVAFDDYTSTRIADLIARCDDAYDVLGLADGDLLSSVQLEVTGDVDRSTALAERDSYSRRIRAYIFQLNYLAATIGVRNYREVL
jgi:hypothetical protein